MFKEVFESRTSGNSSKSQVVLVVPETSLLLLVKTKKKYSASILSAAYVIPNSDHENEIRSL
jgi:hypothetical protein